MEKPDSLNELEEKIPAHVFKRTEKLLYDYPIHVAIINNHPNQVADARSQSRPWPPPEGRNEDGPASDPMLDTYIRVEALTERYHKSRVFVSMIDAVVDTLSDEERRLVKLKYWARNEWPNDVIAGSLNMSRAQFYRLRRRVVRKFAIGCGVLASTG